jgi:hypothetical protein
MGSEQNKCSPLENDEKNLATAIDEDKGIKIKQKKHARQTNCISIEPHVRQFRKFLPPRPAAR